VRWRTGSERVIFKMELLRFLTAGNVDDGKSTLIGKLLVETGNISEEESILLKSSQNKQEIPELSKILDGLKDERTQGITIDVAYRYFQTPERRFIIADCPGHYQYTRNLLVGAAQSDVALVLVDATRSIAEQTKRHIKLLRMLQISKILFVINKMDLVNYSQHKFNEVSGQILSILNEPSLTCYDFIPTSARLGDNLTSPSTKMPWFSGPTVLNYLKNVSIPNVVNQQELRLIVQKTLLDSNKKTGKARAYAGRIISGILKQGDCIRVFPSEFYSKVVRIFIGDEEISKACSPTSVTFTLENDLDIERGNVITLESERCQVSDSWEANIFWFDSTSLLTDKPYLIRHTCQESLARIELNNQENSQWGNDGFSKVILRLSKRNWFDSHHFLKTSGIFLIVDPVTSNSVGAGLIL